MIGDRLLSQPISLSLYAVHRLTHTDTHTPVYTETFLLFETFRPYLIALLLRLIYTRHFGHQRVTNIVSNSPHHISPYLWKIYDFAKLTFALWKSSIKLRTEHKINIKWRTNCKFCLSRDGSPMRGHGATNWPMITFKSVTEKWLNN